MGAHTSARVEPAAGSEPAVFDVLRRAIADGSEIIPLIGSGVSVDAGIPAATPLIDYLVDFKLWVEMTGWPSPRRYLEDNPWPSRHDLIMDLATLPGWMNSTIVFSVARAFHAMNLKRKATKEQLVLAAARHELKGRLATAASVFGALVDHALLHDNPAVPNPAHPTAAVGAFRDQLYFPSTVGYRSLLDLMCEGDQTLIDSFFARIMRGREPTLSQQFIAFLAKHLGSRMVLTTNFDSLIEQALTDEGVARTVYEVVHGGMLPGVRVVRQGGVAVLKLHGGAYSLRTGADLDEPLDAYQLREFDRYFTPAEGRPAPVLLVMGYSGSDRRVMDIVEQHLRARYAGAKPGGATRLVWVSRTGKTVEKLDHIIGRDKLLAQRIKVAHYRDCGRFLQDLYQRLTHQHAVTQHSYRQTRAHDRAVKTVREGARFEEPLEAVKKAMASNLTIIYSPTPGAGTSTLLVQAATQWEKENSAVWINIDACDYRSRATVLSTLANELCRYDRGMTKLHRPLFLADVDYFANAGPEQTRRGADQLADNWEEGMAIRLIRSALRRGTYLITFDSMGEFSKGHPSMDGDHKGRKGWDPGHTYGDRQRKLLPEFLIQLAKEEGAIGNSRMLIAMTNDSNSDPMPDWIAQHPAVVKLLPPEGKSPPDHAKSANQWLETLSTADTDGDMQLLTLIPAVFMRKSRSRASLIALTIRMTRPRNGVTFGKRLRDAKALFRLAVEREERSGRVSTEEGQRIVAARLVDGLARPRSGDEECPILEALEGGFYWMHRTVRNTLYSLVTGSDDLVGETNVAVIYDMLADFAYADAYERSQSSESFVEYFFFRAMSVEHENANPELKYRRCEWMVNTLRNESGQLLGRPAMVPLANHVRSVITMLAGYLTTVEPGYAERLAKALRQTVAVYADLLMTCGHRHTALKYYLWQCELLRATINRSATQWRRDGKTPNDVFQDYSEMDDKGVLKRCDEELDHLTGLCRGFGLPTEPGDRQHVIHMLVDLATAISGSIRSATEISLSRRGRPWINAEGRRRRIDLATRAIRAAHDLAANAVECPTATFRDREILGRVDVRAAELALLGISGTRFDDDPQPCDGDAAAAIIEDVDKGLAALRLGGRSSRRRRHRCYLYLAKARAQALRHQWLDADVTFNRARAALSRTGGVAERSASGIVLAFHAEMVLRQVRVLNGELRAHSRLARLQRRKRLVLNRLALLESRLNTGPDAGERLTLTLQADQNRRRLDSIDDWIVAAGRPADDRASLVDRRDRALRVSTQMLNEARDLLINGSRAENRWRVSLRYLTAQNYRLSAQAASAGSGDTKAVVESMAAMAHRRELLDAAMREVINGLTNSGQRSDSHDLLREEFGKIFRELKSLEELIDRPPRSADKATKAAASAAAHSREIRLRSRYGLMPRHGAVS